MLGELIALSVLTAFITTMLAVGARRDGAPPKRALAH
jgi:hypothetical protein